LARVEEEGPTGAGLLAAVASGFLLAWGLLNAAVPQLLAGAAGLGLLASSALYARLQAARLADGLRREVVGDAVEGRLAVVRLHLPSPGLVGVLAELEDEPPRGTGGGGRVGVLAAPPGGTGYVDYEVRVRPGKRRFGRARARLSDPLGLYRVRLTLDPEERFMYGVPRPRPPPSEVVRAAVEESLSPARLVRGPGIEFHSVREYVDGDDFRLIEWKATARLQKLMVKELRIEASSPVVVLLAPGPRGDEGEPGKTFFEEASRLALGLAGEAASLGSPVGYIGAVEGDLVEAPPKRGPAAVDSTATAIAATPPQGPTPPALEEAVRAYLHKHVRGPATLAALPGPGVEEEVASAVKAAVEGTRVKPVLLRLEQGEVRVEWLR